MSMQPASTQSNQKTITVSVKQKITYNAYFIQPLNASDQFSNAFMSWYIIKENANPYKGGHISNFHMNSNSDMKTLLSQFLSSNPLAVVLLQEITAQEKAKFAMQNNLVHSEFISMLSSGKLNGTSHYVKQTHNSAYLFTKAYSSSTTPPLYVLANPGQWEMVTINYFSVSMWHPGPWWAPWNGYWYSLNYGEQDVINTVYSGMPAQTYYNNIEAQTTIEGILESGLTGTLVGLLAGPEGAVIGAIIGFIAGALVATGYALIGIGFSNIYQSTFADNNWGQKYMWIFMTSDYYYPWITVVGSLESSIGLNGYLSNGVQTIFPQLSWGVPGAIYATDIYESTNSFSNNYGQGVNNFIYEGY